MASNIFLITDCHRDVVAVSFLSVNLVNLVSICK